MMIIIIGKNYCHFKLFWIIIKIKKVIMEEFDIDISFLQSNIAFIVFLILGLRYHAYFY
jgi:hypothetical protein